MLTLLFLSSVKLIVLTLSAEVTPNVVNERFSAPRAYYEDLWQIHCPKEVVQIIPSVSTLQLCLILDVRFEEKQTCVWWRQADVSKADETVLDLMTEYCS